MICPNCNHEVELNLISKSVPKKYALQNKSEVVGVVDNLNNERVATLKRGCHFTAQDVKDIKDGTFDKKLEKSINQNKDNRKATVKNDNLTIDKKGCGKMYCAMENCKQIDETHTAHCLKHGRNIHFICGERGLCHKCEEENKVAPKCIFCKDTKFLGIKELDGTITPGRCPQCYKGDKEEIRGIVDNLNDERVATLINKKVCRNLFDYNNKVCGIDGLCDECETQNKGEPKC